MLLTPIKVGDKLFNLPIIALTAHFKYHGSFDHEQFASRRAWFNYFDQNEVLNNKNGKIKKINLSFLYLYVFFLSWRFFFHVIVSTIHGNTKCI